MRTQCTIAGSADEGHVGGLLAAELRTRHLTGGGQDGAPSGDSSRGRTRSRERDGIHGGGRGGRNERRRAGAQAEPRMRLHGSLAPEILDKRDHVHHDGHLLTLSSGPTRTWQRLYLTGPAEGQHFLDLQFSSLAAAYPADLRRRISPSCTTETTSVPSSV